MAGDALLEERGLRADADLLADGRPDHRAGRRRAEAAAATRSTGCAGSGSTSSPTARGSATSPSSSTTTPAGWSGRPTGATSRRSRPSSTSSARSAAPLELVSSDLGEWITRAVAERCPPATLCLDPYHVVALASDALDEVRREVWNEARRAGDKTGARWLKGARWALWKRPERLTDRQQAKLHTIEHVNRPPLPRLPPEGAAAARLPRARRGRRDRAPRRLARLGTPLPDRELRQARQDDHSQQRRDRRDAHPPALERPDRSDQHHPAPDLPPRLRLPLRPRADRARHAHRRRPPTAAPRPITNPRIR